MRDWFRQHPVGFQASVFGITFPLLMGAFGRWTGFPQPFTGKFLAYWVVLGIFTGALYYGIFRLMGARASSPK